MFIIIAIVILGFAISLAFAFGGSTSSEKSFEERLREMSRDPKKIDLNELELEKPFSERIITPIIERIASLGARIAPHEVLNETKKKINQSGMKLKPGTFIGFQVILAILLPALLAMMGVMGKSGGVKGAMILLGSGLLGYFMPDLWLRGKVSSRKIEIQRALPDALDLLTVSVEAGLGFDMALSKVVEKLKGPLADEFGQVLHEVRMGKPRRDAMKALAVRVDSPDVSQFIAALVQADKLGVSLANVLRVQSDQMRLRRRQRAEQTAMRAPLKMSFVLVFFVLPALMIVLLGPAVIQVVAQLGDNENL